jgi:MFS family permease
MRLDIGLSPKEIGYFLAAILVGGALAQFPTGALADRYDRRHVLIAMSIFSILICTTMSLVGGDIKSITYLTAFLFGAATYPIFSLSAAHANDYSSPEQRIELNACLMFYYATGAVLSPLIASGLIQVFGAPSMFIFISIAHVILVIFGLLRMRTRATNTDKTRYSYMPRTSFTIGRLLRRKPLGDD